jgi:hypothetical protein
LTLPPSNPASISPAQSHMAAPCRATRSISSRARRWCPASRRQDLAVAQAIGQQAPGQLAHATPRLSSPSARPSWPLLSW